MVINTHTVRVLNSRKTVMELILSDHPTDCLICAKSGNCDLQTMAHKLELDRFISRENNRPTAKIHRHRLSAIWTNALCVRRCETMCNTFQTVWRTFRSKSWFYGCCSTCIRTKSRPFGLYLLWDNALLYALPVH